MSRYGDITLPFAGEDRIFRLGLGERRAIEEKCDAGLPVLASRLAPMMRLAQISVGLTEAEKAQLLLQAVVTGQLGTFRTDDYREPIFRGLVGGGMEATMATVMVKQFVDEQAPMQSAIMAFQILMAHLLGPEDEPLGETKGAKEPPPKKSRSRAARPASPTSTPPAPSSAGRPTRSTRPAPGSSSPAGGAGRKPTASKAARSPRRSSSTSATSND